LKKEKKNLLFHRKKEKAIYPDIRGGKVHKRRTRHPCKYKSRNRTKIKNQGLQILLKDNGRTSYLSTFRY
jgi:hypothetical protein